MKKLFLLLPVIALFGAVTFGANNNFVMARAEGDTSEVVSEETPSEEVKGDE